MMTLQSSILRSCSCSNTFRHSVDIHRLGPAQSHRDATLGITNPGPRPDDLGGRQHLNRRIGADSVQEMNRVMLTGQQ